jgi:hypothetical protein
MGPSRVPVWVAALLSAGWLLFVGLDLAPRMEAGAPEIGELVSAALLPVGALFAVAAAIMMAGWRAADPPALPDDALDLAEARLSASIARVEALKLALAEQVSALDTMAAELPGRADSLGGMVDALRRQAGEADALAGRLEALLAPLGRQSEALARQLHDAVAAAGEQAVGLEERARLLSASLADTRATGASSVEALEALIADMEGRLESRRASAGAALAALSASAADQLATAEQSAERVRELVAEQAAAVGRAVEEARHALAAIGGEAAQQLTRRLESIAGEAAAVDERLKAQVATAAELGETAERSFQRMDARLAHAAETSGRTFDQLAARIAAVNAAADGVAVPLRDSRALTAELEGAVAALRATALETIDAFGQTMPARTVEASRAAETMAGELSGLLAALEAATERVSALGEPIEASRLALVAAAEAFGGQRAAMETAGRALVVELEQARQLIAEVEEATRDTSLAAATRLVDAMTRVREVSAQAAGTMRETLDAVIGEARDSLAAAADTAMRQSFVGPVAAQAEAAQAAAAQAAQRTAASMAALASTLKLLEDRSTETRAGLDEALRADLNAAAAFLEDRMAAASVSIATALDKPMSQADWEAWKRGERGLFNRRAVTLLEKREAGALKALMANDPGFADAARRYTADFESLVARLGGEGTLALALRNSETGRLAAALAEAEGGRS